jgi:exopolyphosphatase/guanosine-5'-triphosphate,3'-diphosphate pyrophosphatase
LQESGRLSLANVETLISLLCDFDKVAEVALSGLSERRAQVWPGGLAILAELLIALRIPALHVSDGALREGLLYDLLGRLQHEDARERTVQAMASRYHVDQRQAGRVADTAQNLLQQCAEAWGLLAEFDANILSWSATLHEIGLDISHDGFQRHGSYVAENADMPGFPRAEQRYLAFLIGSQRHDINMRLQKQLPRAWRDDALRLAILLRLAVLVNRSRSDAELPELSLSVQDRSLHLKFSDGWLSANQLTAADLQRERSYLVAAGYELNFD